MSPRLVVAMLSLMLGMQALTTDLYLPALPQLRNDLAAQKNAQRKQSFCLRCASLRATLPSACYLARK